MLWIVSGIICVRSNLMDVTIESVINSIQQAVLDTVSGTSILSDTVDVVKIGDPTRIVTGIVTTMFATVEVIRTAKKLGANLIITHEPTFYNHLDKNDTLQDDPVYLGKRSLAVEYGITIWRFHDYWHLHRPDGILTGMLKDLGWESDEEQDKAHLVNVSPMTLADLITLLKEKLQIRQVRVVGDPGMLCSRVGLLLGACPGEWHIQQIRDEKLDVLVVGEVNEWEAPEYVRDAISLGGQKALIILGHANSEDPGMRYLVEWLKPKVKGIPVTFVQSGDPFQVL
jgi:putative NIF3 family GTP cyclohydrolase 1 type 2